MKKLSKEDIQAACNSGAYFRGSDYYLSGKVLDIELLSNKGKNQISLHSKVEGSGGNVYHQIINITESPEGLGIKGRCGCPVRENCKHVVAACLVFNDIQIESSDGSIDTSDCLSWIENFASKTDKRPDQDQEVGQEFIAYLLKPFQNPNELEVKFVITRRKKSGGLNKGRAGQPYNFSNSFFLPNYAEKIDAEIANLLDTSMNRRHGRYVLSDSMGYTVMERMLKTGRCYWQDHANPPLALGESREYEFEWLKEKNGDLRLSLNINPPAQILLFTPVMYLDPLKSETGLLRGASFNYEQWKMLLDAPVVSPDMATEFSRYLAIRMPESPLPAPVEVEVENVEKEAIPTILLKGRKLGNHDFVHVIELSFTYGGYNVNPHPIEKLSIKNEKGKVVNIHRDVEQERKAFDYLVDEGFGCIPDYSNGTYQFVANKVNNVMESAAIWQVFMEETLPELKKNNWIIEYGKNFKLDFVEAEDVWDLEIDEGSDWFDLRFDLTIDGEKVPLLPMISEVLNSYTLEEIPQSLSLPVGDSRYVSVTKEQIFPICEVIYEIFESMPKPGDASLRLNRYEAAHAVELDDRMQGKLQWQGGDKIRELGNKLKDFEGIKDIPVPEGLNAELRHYQQEGLNWLQFLREYQFAGILADDMGLGKTLQTLTSLLYEKQQGRMTNPSLIIAPTSLMSNWYREAEKFTPDLKILILQGANRKSRFAEINDYDIVLSTYPLLARDADVLLAQQYYYLVLDEAQNIKNPKAKATQVVQGIKSAHKLCLTGTPMENHLGELWSQFNFLMPGLLGNEHQFKKQFRTPIEKHSDDGKRRWLSRRIAPFMIRRTKNAVAKELPAKTEIIRSVALGKKQAALYESIRLTMERRVRDAIAKKGIGRSHIMILDALLKLRQTCCDPSLLSLDQAAQINESAKLDMLREMLPEMLEEGRRVLLFSQFAKMLAIIENELNVLGIGYTKLTGQTRKRDDAIQRFKNGEVDVFLVSLKAGGVGLNLTEADTVIHFDPWWNPAAENQATDRAYRIGQDKPVFVYKLITENTVEEKILAMQDKKRALVEGIIDKKQGESDLKISADDLEVLFQPIGQ